MDVHCRTGSLEKEMSAKPLLNGCSLPHRQLRKTSINSIVDPIGSLPHRQLRKMLNWLPNFRLSSLPHRQLRKVVIISAIEYSCSLPHRQLRKK